MIRTDRLEEQDRLRAPADRRPEGAPAGHHEGADDPGMGAEGQPPGRPADDAGLLPPAHRRERRRRRRGGGQGVGANPSMGGAGVPSPARGGGDASATRSSWSSRHCVRDRQFRENHAYSGIHRADRRAARGDGLEPGRAPAGAPGQPADRAGRAPGGGASPPRWRALPARRAPIAARSTAATWGAPCRRPTSSARRSGWQS